MATHTCTRAIFGGKPRAQAEADCPVCQMLKSIGTHVRQDMPRKSTRKPRKN